MLSWNERIQAVAGVNLMKPKQEEGRVMSLFPTGQSSILTCPTSFLASTIMFSFGIFLSSSFCGAHEHYQQKTDPKKTHYEPISC